MALSNQRHLSSLPETIFPVGSISKQSTAMAVEILLEEGSLGRNVDLRRYLPELPEYERPITIDHLLHHTSGVRDYRAVRFLAGQTTLEASRVFTLLSRQRHLNFPPGDQFRYSNAGYVLLRFVIEPVSGKSLPEFARVPCTTR